MKHHHNLQMICFYNFVKLYWLLFLILGTKTYSVDFVRSYIQLRSSFWVCFYAFCKIRPYISEIVIKSVWNIFVSFDSVSLIYKLIRYWITWFFLFNYFVLNFGEFIWIVEIHRNDLRRIRKNDVSKPVTNNVFGYIWEIQAIGFLYQPKLSFSEESYICTFNRPISFKPWPASSPAKVPHLSSSGGTKPDAIQCQLMNIYNCMICVWPPSRALHSIQSMYKSTKSRRNLLGSPVKMFWSCALWFRLCVKPMFFVV